MTVYRSLGKKALALGVWCAASLWGISSLRADLIISEILDGTLTGGLPKFVEITNVGCDPVDLSEYSLGNINNGAATMGFDATPLSGILAAGDSYVVSYENSDSPGSSTFFQVYGFDADNLTPGSFINGDDVLVLFFGQGLAGDPGDGSVTPVVDVYGVVGVDGTGEVWDYEDSYVFRNANVLAGNAGVFDPSEWFIAGANVLDGASAGDIAAVTSPGSHVFDDPGCGGTCGNGIVDVGEECDGGACCTAQCTLALSGTVCRDAVGVCDVEEVCDGQSADCANDSVADAGTECRSSAGACDVPEFCDGVEVDCPADSFVDAGTECRPAAGACDEAEVCDGVSRDCPSNEVLPFDTECRPAVGDCDQAEFCDGANVDCPEDLFVEAGAVCRPAIGICDVAEMCDGTSAVCPEDELSSFGSECRTSTGPCDSAESCDGVSVDCPADQVITVCENGDGCCPSSCNETTDSDCEPVCSNGVVETGEECDDGNQIDGDGCSSDCLLEGPDVIPTTSEWGLFILASLLAAAAKLYFGPRSEYA